MWLFPIVIASDHRERSNPGIRFGVGLDCFGLRPRNDDGKTTKARRHQEYQDHNERL